MAEVVIGVGTNLGDRLAHLRHGVRALRRAAPLLRPRAVSPIYESDALVPDGAPEQWQRPYLNLAVLAEWEEEPRALLVLLKDIEARLGRRPRERWGPREVDFDLLAFDALEQSEPGLTLPHPGLADRPFALLPFADVAPAWRFAATGPLAGLTAAAAASRWRGPPDRVPLQTRRTFFSLSEVVGILNVTPDSFSDGGRWLTPGLAVLRARELASAGAAVLDLGAESTRPGAAAVTPPEEWARLEPVLAALLEGDEMMHRGDDGAPRVLVSVDTRHPQVAERALDAGAHWINDVTGLRDPRMVAVVAGSAADVVVMHSLSVPPSRAETIPSSEDPVAHVVAWASRRLDELTARGIPAERVILDPGIGFGKTADQSAELVRRAGELTGLGARLMVGHSRKSFLAEWYEPGAAGATEASARDLETAVLSAHLAAQGVDYLRVHEVAPTRQALRAEAFVGAGVRFTP